MAEELKKELENMSLEELDVLASKIEAVKSSVESKIVDVKQEDLVPERTSRGSKNR